MPVDPRMFAPIKIGDILERGQQRELRKMQIENEKAEIEGKRAERDAYAQVFSGGMDESGVLGRPNRQSLGALARVNPEAAMKVQKYFDSLDESGRKREESKWKAAGPVLMRLKTIPPEQRAAFAQAALPQLQAAGWTPEELANVDLSDQSIDALATTAMTVDQVLDSQKLRWNPIGENGSFATDHLGNPVGEGNPFAPQAPKGPPQQSESLNDVFGSLIQQESGGRPGVVGPRTAYGVPLGKTQLLPDTAKEMAAKLGLPWKPELLKGTNAQASAYQEQLGRAYFDEGLQKNGGNVERALMYYHGGPNEKLWGPKTRTYAKAVLARTGRSGPRKVSSREEYQSLPPGTQYIAPDGSLRTKS
jgi:soluble lytic murein transglycosylase-like protein